MNTPYTPTTQAYIDQIRNSFFGWWITNYRVSFLIIALVLIYGLFVAIKIPKESAPDIKFGIVQITTPYPGANPVDIDDVVTSKIEEKIKNLAGIDKIESTSSLGVSNVTITLTNSTDVKDFIADVRTKVDTIAFPSDVKDRVITELSTANEVLFQMILYAPTKMMSMNHLRTLAMQFKDDIKGKGSIVDVKIDGVPGDSDFAMQIQLDPTKIEGYGLTLAQVLGQIRAYNQNLPLGNYALGTMQYDYRIDNSLGSLEDLTTIPISIPGAGSIKLGDIASIVRHYTTKTVTYGGIAGSANNHAIGLTIYKKDRSNVFVDAKSAKELISTTLQKIQFSGLQSAYTLDLADTIIDDYSSLAWNGVTSVCLIFIITAIFIGLRQSLIATIAMPIAFFITFMILNALGLSMNFMTNFSLILSFGMGIDTVIVFIESARENMKKGYNPTNAILITMQMYAKPNIITSLINIVVFVPMLVLPGITGKFLSYIPITLFATLLGSLFLALTVNGALFAKFNKKLDYYYNDDEHDESLSIMNDAEKEILYAERQGKISIPLSDAPWLEQKIDEVRNIYVSLLRYILPSTMLRRLTILVPIGLVVASTMILGPSIGFKLFPSGDNPQINFIISSREGTRIETMARIVSGVDTIIAQLPEVKSYTIQINPSKVDVSVSLTKKDLRTRDSFAVQADLESGFAYLKTQGYKVEGKVMAGGPPVGKAVGLKLVADDKKLLPELRTISKIFETYIQSLTGTINVSNSSIQSPGQFSFAFDKDRLAQLGISPADVQSEIYAAINGLKAGTITIDNKERDMVVKMKTFAGDVSPEMIYNLSITTRSGPVHLSDIMSISTDPALTSIKRKNGDIVIGVEADLTPGLQPTSVQPSIESFAAAYSFPAGISYKPAGENDANADLIQSAIMAFFIALFMTFVLLVYQFNSFSKPAIVLYSVLTALLGVNVGLRVTGNPYSMAFGIGFISLLGVIVNTAIFLVDRINENTKKGVGLSESIFEAGQARFKPIIISTLTTILGLGSVVTQDEFYAGLGFTVIFGLLFSSVITLIAVPVLYYSVFKNKSL